MQGGKLWTEKSPRRFKRFTASLHKYATQCRMNLQRLIQRLHPGCVALMKPPPFFFCYLRHQYFRSVTKFTKSTKPDLISESGKLFKIPNALCLYSSILVSV